MSEYLSLIEFLELAKTAKRVLVHREMSADCLTPISVVESLGEAMKQGIILESGLSHSDDGRYSFIAFNALASFQVQNNQVQQVIGSKQTQYKTKAPFSDLREFLQTFSLSYKQTLKQAMMSAAGFITYDAVRFFEAIPDRHGLDSGLPEIVFNIYETTLIFDHLNQKLIISKIVEVSADQEKSYHKAQEKISALITKINTAHHSQYAHSSNKVKQQIDADIHDDEFMQLVERAKDYIIKGDALQIVLSRSFTRKYTVTPFEIYRALRRVSPAPYLFYFPIRDSVIMGASPEKMLSVKNKEVMINPIAGTRKRLGENDETIAYELLNNKKEVAEHMMLVDLARNDLGLICKPNTIKVTDLLQVKHYSHVSHITSKVKGQLHESKDAFDAFAAAFPAGTLSGAPKVRAMEIIDELETSKRGIYGGAICRLNYEGDLDSCIAIRMAVLKDGIASIRAGAGIVYDSDPLAEANETRAKAKSLIDAIALAEGETL